MPLPRRGLRWCLTRRCPAVYSGPGSRARGPAPGGVVPGLAQDWASLSTFARVYAVLLRWSVAAQTCRRRRARHTTCRSCAGCPSAGSLLPATTLTRAEGKLELLLRRGVVRVRCVTIPPSRDQSAHLAPLYGQRDLRLLRALAHETRRGRPHP
jgi:hypothetical protein